MNLRKIASLVLLAIGAMIVTRATPWRCFVTNSG
jgi:hypothetical protein